MTRYTAARPMRVALAGFGNVGREVARRLIAGTIPEVRLTAIAGRDLDNARANCAGLEPPPLVAVHLIEVDAENIQLRLESRNGPSATNPRTSRAVAPSILAALRALISPVQVGS